MSGYLVRTKSGDKGPFDLTRLGELVAAGKLPITTRVIEAESGLAVALEDLLSFVETPTTETLAEEPSEPPARPPPSRPAPRRGARSDSAGRSPRGTAPGVPRGARGTSAARRRRSATSFRRQRSATPIVVLAIVAIAGGVGYTLWSGTDRALEGRWVIDSDATLDLLRKTSEFQSMPPDQRELALAAFRGMAEAVEFTFRRSEVTTRLGAARGTAPYRIASQNGGHYEVEILERDGSVAERLEFAIQGNRMFMQGRGASAGGMASVLVKK